MTKTCIATKQLKQRGLLFNQFPHEAFFYMDQRIAAKSRSLFFAELRSQGNSNVSNMLQCSESTVSELSGKDKYKFNFDNFPDLLARMGLKIVPAEFKCYDPAAIDHLMYMAKRGMESMSAESLEWDGD